MLLQKIICASFVMRTRESFLFNQSKARCGCRGLLGLPKPAWKNYGHSRVPSAHRGVSALPGLAFGDMPVSL